MLYLLSRQTVRLSRGLTRHGSGFILITEVHFSLKTALLSLLAHTPVKNRLNSFPNNNFVVKISRINSVVKEFHVMFSENAISRGISSEAN